MSGAQILRYELFRDGGGVDLKWRPLVNLEHSTLCAQAGLDPVRHWFDLPSSARGVGSASSGSRGGRAISGFIMRAGQDSPAGKVVFVTEGERFRDVDPRSRADFERLT